MEVRDDGRARDGIHLDQVAIRSLRRRGQHRAHQRPAVGDTARRPFPPPPPSVHPLVRSVVVAQHVARGVVVAVAAAAKVEPQQVGEDAGPGLGDGGLVAVVDGGAAVETPDGCHGDGRQGSRDEGSAPRVVEGRVGLTARSGGPEEHPRP